MTVVEEKDDSNKHIPFWKHHDIYVRIDQVRDNIYTYQTRKFPITSSRGHKYIMILCEINGNVVLAYSMKNKSEASMVETYQNLIKRLNDAGIFPKSILWITKYLKDIRRKSKQMEWLGNWYL